MNTSTILEVLRNYADGYFQLHEEYAEPGYDSPESGLIATGNWNSQTTRRKVYDKPIPDWLTVKNPDETYEHIDNTMPRIGAILEKLGAVLEWEDEWEICEECHKLVRTQPDSYSWKRSYWLDDCDLHCHECIRDDPEEYLEHLEGNPKTANTLDLDLEEHEYRKVDADFENGLCGGQCDDPKIIAEGLRKLGVERFIFEIDGVAQFGLSFSVWVHESEWNKTISWLDPAKIESKGDDPAVAMQTALRDASTKLATLDGPGVKVAKCHAGGTATVKLVSEWDFIDGKALA
jgi:hypothetical protein